MSFLRALYYSLFDLNWLKLQRINARFAWKFFLGFVLLVTCIVAIPLWFGLPSFANDLRGQVQSMPDFQATITGGELTVQGVTQPYVFESDDKGFKVVVDTVSTSTQSIGSRLASGQSGLLITKKDATFYDAEQDMTRTENWSDAPTSSINKMTVVGYADQYTSTGYLVLYAILLFVLLYIGGVVAKLYALFIVTVIVYCLARITRRAWLFRELFSVGLVSIALPTIVALVVQFIVPVSGAYFMALLAFMLAIVFTNDGTKVVEEDAEELE